MNFAAMAWRNILKRARRSSIMVLSIGVGVFGLLFFQVTMDGFAVVMVDAVVDTTMGHLQVHRKDYLLKREHALFIPSPEKVIAVIAGDNRISGYSPRVVLQGLVSSPANSVSSRIYGLDPLCERSVTDIRERIVEGALPGRGALHCICVGCAMAAKLRVEMGDKVVVMVRDINGELSGEALRVCGIFRGLGDSQELACVYVSIKQALELLGKGSGCHEIAVHVRNVARLDEVCADLTAELGDDGGEISVKTWKQLVPSVYQQIEMAYMPTVFMGLVVFIALAFGIVNAFLMEIFERIHEFGVMMSLGTRPVQVFAMLLYEGAFIGALGAFLGTVTTFLVTNILLDNVMDLSLWASGLAYYDFPSKVPLNISVTALVYACCSTITVSVLATVLPALWAISFKPVEALRQY